MRSILSLGIAMTLAGSGVSAQPVPAQQRFGLAAYLQGAYGGMKRTIQQEAQRMPAADYGFKPSSMPEVRTYGQVFVHIAEGQFGTCAALRGVTNPHQGERLEATLKGKDEIVALLAESFAMCDPAFAELTDANALEFVKQGPGEVARGGVLAGLLAHGAEMYGIATVYLRAKNIVPATTEQQGRGRGR
ncbi:MAG TPA: DinB family protein [Vicinamibacterales bacterium]|nr:DinB family protein [Vicinamibacterales bacterium]